MKMGMCLQQSGNPSAAGTSQSWRGLAQHQQAANERCVDIVRGCSFESLVFYVLDIFGIVWQMDGSGSVAPSPATMQGLQAGVSRWQQRPVGVYHAPLCQHSHNDVFLRSF